MESLRSSSSDRHRARRGAPAPWALALPLLLGSLALFEPTQAGAVSTLPCPSVGAQPQSTPSLGAGQDNACENWGNLPLALSGANVSAANLNRAWIWADFSNANLAGTNFSGALLSSGIFRSSFNGANLTNTSFQNASASFASFDDAIFVGTNLTGASFHGASFDRVNLSGFDLRTTVLSQVRFNDANLSSANLSGRRLGSTVTAPFSMTRTNFSNATMTGVELVAGLIEPVFVSTNLTQAILSINATDGDFTNAFLFQAQVFALFTRGTLANAILVDANLSNVRFIGTNLTGAVMGPGTILNGTRYDAATIFPSGSTFVGPTFGLPGGVTPLDAGMLAIFDDADFSGRNFTNVDFMNASMQVTINLGTLYTNADLSNCNFRFAELEGAILTGANLTAATLTNATYDPTTIFPSGNNYASSPWGLPGGLAPWQMGMIPVPEPGGSAVALGAVVGLLAAARARRSLLR